MSRLIDADEALEKAIKYGFRTKSRNAREFFEDECPTVDAVPVVRCRDCKYWDKQWFPIDKDLKLHWCKAIDHSTFGDQYCDRGQKIAEEVDK